MKKEPRKMENKSVADLFDSIAGRVEPEKENRNESRILVNDDSCNTENKKSCNQENKKPGKKVSNNSSITIKREVQKKPRTVMHGEIEYRPANMMLRADFRKQIKHYAADHDLLDYQVIDIAIEQFFNSK